MLLNKKHELSDTMIIRVLKEKNSNSLIRKAVVFIAR